MSYKAVALGSHDVTFFSDFQSERPSSRPVSIEEANIRVENLKEAIERFHENIEDPKVGILSATLDNLIDSLSIMKDVESVNILIRESPLPVDAVTFLSLTLDGEFSEIFRRVFLLFLDFFRVLTSVFVFTGDLFIEAFRMLLDCIAIDPSAAPKIATVLMSLSHDANEVECVFPRLAANDSISRLFVLLKEFDNHELRDSVVTILQNVFQAASKTERPTDSPTQRLVEIANSLMGDLGTINNDQIQKAVVIMLYHMIICCPSLWTVIVTHPFMRTLLSMPQTDSQHSVFALCLLKRIIGQFPVADLPGVVVSYLNFGNLRDMVCYERDTYALRELFLFSRQFVVKYTSLAISRYFENGIYRDIVLKLKRQAWPFKATTEAIRLLNVSIAVSSRDDILRFFDIDDLVPVFIEFMANTEDTELVDYIIDSFMNMHSTLAERSRQGELSEMLANCGGFEVLNTLETSVDHVHHFLSIIDDRQFGELARTTEEVMPAN